jgi:hypothetical protein
MPDLSNSTGDSDIDAALASASTPSIHDTTGDPDIDAVMKATSVSGDYTPKSEWSMENLKRQGVLVARAVVSGVTGLPAMAADVGVAGRNLYENLSKGIYPTLADFNPFARTGGTPQTYELPSQSFQRALTSAGIPAPQSLGEKIAGTIEGGLAGSAMPGPTVESDVPANFTGAQDMAAQQRLQAVKNGMDEGYKVPPSTTNPTIVNKTLETVSGKLATQNAASQANQSITNRLAARSLGLNEDLPITEASLNAVRSEAAKDYQAIGQAGPIQLDQAFKDRIQSIVSQFNKTAEEVPSLANEDLEPVATDLLSKDQLSGNAVLGAVKGLRNKADMAFRQGDGSTGMAYKSMASEMEGAVDRDLSGRGPQFEELVNSFRDARQKIAIAHTVEDAMNPGTGNILAPKLAAALRRGEPLSGPLRTIAEFANSVPKAVQEPTSSGVSHLQAAIPTLSAIGEAAVHGVGPGTAAAAVAYPAARAGTRWWLMGPGQGTVIPKAAATTMEAPWWFKAAPGAVAGAQE